MFFVGDGIAQRNRSRFPSNRPGFESSDRWKNRTHLSLRTCRSICLVLAHSEWELKKAIHVECLY